MKCHIVGVPYSKIHDDFVIDAFSYKQQKFINMMSEYSDIEFIFYGHEDSVIKCELVPCTSNKVLKTTFGLVNDDFYWKGTHTHDYAHHTLNRNAAQKIHERLEPDDLILNFWQVSAVMLWQKYGLPYDQFVDIGHGSEIFPVSKYVSYESHWLQGFIHGRMVGEKKITNTDVMHQHTGAVIPLPCDVTHFTFTEEKDDYYFFVGRLIPLKGIMTIMNLAYDFPDRKFIIAGYGEKSEQHFLIIERGNDVITWDDFIEWDNVEFVGTVDRYEKDKYLSKAKALLVPTRYGEPFGGVVSEAHSCGTPVISTDWGAFVENNPHKQTGIRCRTLDCWRKALDEVEIIEPEKCRQYVIENYGLEVVAYMYDNFLRRCGDFIKGKGEYDYDISYKLDIRNNKTCRYL